MSLAKYALILLAAGESSRMGSPKQLIEFKGKPLIRHAAEVALGTVCDVVVVVVGAHAGLIRVALTLAGLGGIEVVKNARWTEGIGTSIQAGLRAAEEFGCDGAILALADQPLVTSAMLDRLIIEHERTGQPIVASRYAGTAGVPAFFAKSHFPQLLALAPDQGCKGVILRNADAAVLIDCPEASTDVDTALDYAGIDGGPTESKP